MNKTLLTLLACATCTGAAYAAIQTPVVYDGASIQAISANGNVAVSETTGVITVYDLANGTSKVYADEGDGAYYGIGYGRFMTADGSIIVGNTREDADAAYLDATGWHQLQVPDPEKTNISHGITPDGSRICGNVGAHEMTIQKDVLMQVPVYWDRNADGTYGECHVLPHPQTDFFGATPQYLTALCISEDGKTIIGQMTDCRGAMTVPVVYTQGADGEWSYTLPTKDLFNPNGLESPEDPGEAPVAPDIKNFMSEEQRAAYEAAYQEWLDSGYTLPYPEETNYMTEEELAAYNAAMEAYQIEYAAWDEKFIAQSNYYQNVVDQSPNFLFNNASMSVDGSKVALSAVKYIEDPMAWFPVAFCTPWIIDLSTGEITKYESDQSVMVSDFCDGDVLLGSNGEGQLPVTAFVMKDGMTTTLEEYLNTISPEYGEWVKKNMSHEIMDYVFNEETESWEEVYNELTFTGIPVATPDLKKIAIATDTPWDFMLGYQSVIFDLSQFSGIEEVASEATGLELDATGNLKVKGVADVRVYDLTGACVVSVENATGTVALDINSGVYVAVASFTDGTNKVLKLAK